MTSSSFLSFYFNDFLFPIVYLPIINLLKYLFEKTEKIETITLKFCLTWASVFSVWFELITPLYQPKVTADVYDAISYFAGAIVLFYIEIFMIKRGIID